MQRSGTLRFCSACSRHASDSGRPFAPALVQGGLLRCTGDASAPKALEQGEAFAATAPRDCRDHDHSAPHASPQGRLARRALGWGKTEPPAQLPRTSRAFSPTALMRRSPWWPGSTSVALECPLGSQVMPLVSPQQPPGEHDGCPGPGLESHGPSEFSRGYPSHGISWSDRGGWCWSSCDELMERRYTWPPHQPFTPEGRLRRQRKRRRRVPQCKGIHWKAII